MPDCASDEYVVIAGNQRFDGSLQIWNWPNGLLPSKSSHTYTSKATSLTDVTFVQDWSSTDPARKGFFKEKAPGSNLTYGEIIKRVTAMSGISEENIAAFCDSMVQTDFYAISKVSNSSDYKTTSYNDTHVVKEKKTVYSSNRTVNVGDVAYVTFAHNIYANVQANNVSWEVRRNVTVPNGSTIAGFYAGKDTNNSGGGYYTISMPAHIDWSWNLTREKSNGTANITQWKSIHNK